jgi:hypothetical protein
MNDDIQFIPPNSKTCTAIGWVISKIGASAVSCGGVNAYLPGTISEGAIYVAETKLDALASYKARSQLADKNH